MEKLIRIGNLEITSDKVFGGVGYFEIWENGVLVGAIMDDSLYYFDKSVIKNLPAILEEFEGVEKIKHLKPKN